MKFFCWLWGHKWSYNFGWLPNKRTCNRCGEKEVGKFNPNFKHPLKDDIFIWEKKND